MSSPIADNAMAGAASALTVDSSQGALEWAVANAQRNGVRVDSRRGDAFEVLEALHADHCASPAACEIASFRRVRSRSIQPPFE